MYPLDVVEESDLTGPPLKRSRTMLEKSATLHENDHSFLSFENDFYDRSLFSNDDIGVNGLLATTLSQTCFPNDLPDQTSYHQLTSPPIGDSPPVFGMPYVYPAQPTPGPKCGIYSCSESGASLGEFENASSPLCEKKDTTIKGALSEPLTNNPLRVIYPSAFFCTVPSRTALQKPKILTVTVGEVYRRVFGPEMMNVSLLGSYLRRAKEKDGGKTLRDELKRLDMYVPLGRRKNGGTTTWTCFVEEETERMALDLDMAARKFFPVQRFAQTIRERLNHTDDVVRNDVFSVRKILKLMRSIFSDDCSPVHGREIANLVLNEELQDGMYKYSCATHGFGSLALISAIDLFDAFMEALLEDIDRVNEDGSCSSSLDSV